MQNSSENDPPNNLEDENEIKLITHLLVTIVKNQESQQAWVEHFSEKLDAILDHIGVIR